MGEDGDVHLYRDEGVVLRTQKLGEADRIVTLLTRRHGRVRAVAKGVRRTASRFGARVEPFTQVDLLLHSAQVPGASSLDIVTSMTCFLQRYARSLKSICSRVNRE